MSVSQTSHQVFKTHFHCCFLEKNKSARTLKCDDKSCIFFILSESKFIHIYGTSTKLFHGMIIFSCRPIKLTDDCFQHFWITSCCYILYFELFYAYIKVTIIKSPSVTLYRGTTCKTPFLNLESLTETCCEPVKCYRDPLMSYDHRGEKGRGEIGGVYLPTQLERTLQLWW
jgi:hypothetical protein